MKMYPDLKSKKLVDIYTGKIIKADRPFSHRIIMGIPTTGLVRYEWLAGRMGQVIPCNWSQAECVQYYNSWTPIGYQVADARNIIATIAIREKFEYLWFIDHDVVLVPSTILKWNDYMLKREIPVWSGLYFTKGTPSEPIIYRDLGKSYYRDWKFGDKVWVSHLPMGNTIIHTSILKAMEKDCEKYDIGTIGGTMKITRFFITPAHSYLDPENLTWFNTAGTEDLNWCQRVVEGGYLKKAGWTKVANKKYPFLIDTNIFCTHIDNDGVQYPANGEQNEFVKVKK